MSLVPLDPATLRPLPSTPALSGVLETLAFFRDPDFARSRFERYGDVYETRLLGQRTVFIRGGQAISDLFAQGDAVQGWWPGSVRELLGPLSLANRHGADHKARRRVVGQLFASAALKRYSPSIVALVNALSQELIASQAPVALVPKLRRFAFSVIASRCWGLTRSIAMPCSWISKPGARVSSRCHSHCPAAPSPVPARPANVCSGA